MSRDSNELMIQVFDVVIDHGYGFLGLEDVARLSACDQSFRAKSQQLISRQRGHWLQSAASSGRAAAVQALGDGHADVVAACSTALMSTPNITLEVAAALISAGMRPTYAEMVLAASQGIAGVHIWARAYQQLQIPVEMPQEAFAVCCGEPVGDLDGVQDLRGLLLLAIDSRDEHVVRGICTWHAVAALQQLGTAGLVALLQRVRPDAEAAEELRVTIVSLQASLQAAVEQLQPAEMLDLLQEAFTGGCCWDVFGTLTHLRAASNVERTGLVRLLERAMDAGNKHAVRMFSGLLVNQLEAADLLRLLEKAVDRGDSDSVRTLSHMPAFEQLGLAVVMQLLERAVRGGDRGTVIVLLIGDMIEQLDYDDVLRLMARAVEGGKADVLLAVYHCVPAVVQQLMPDDILRMLEGAVAKGADGVVHVLCSMPAANALKPERVLHMLTTAVDVGHGNIVAYLCSLPAAMELQPSSVASLIVTSIKLVNVQAVSALCQAASCVLHPQPASVLQIMEAAISATEPCRQVVRNLAEVLAVARPHGLLRVAAEGGNHEVLQAVCRLAGVQSVGPDKVLQRLQGAMQRGQQLVVYCLCQLKGAQQLSAAEVRGWCRRLPQGVWV